MPRAHERPRNGVERAVACLAASPAIRRAGLRLDRIAGGGMVDTRRRT